MIESGHKPEEPFRLPGVDDEASSLYDCPRDFCHLPRFVFSQQLNLSQILQEKIHTFFCLAIRDGLFNCSLKGTELELACQRANLARGASAEIVREQGLFPDVAWPPGFKAKGQERTFLQEEAGVLQDGIGDFIFNEFAFDLRSVMVGPIEDENISRLKPLLNEVYGDFRGELCFCNLIGHPYP